MHYKEAEWIKDVLARFDVDNLSPMLNLGSSTEDFRTVQQPFITDLVFAPLLSRGVSIYHSDLKSDRGVDLIGNIINDDFRDSLKEINFKAIICCNLLEHVDNLEKYFSALNELLSPGSILVITVPFRYPRHMDPIDTMYRPSPDDIVSRFRGVTLINTAMIDVGAPADDFRLSIRSVTKLLLRVMFPFYRFNGWLTVIARLCHFFRPRIISCVVVKKN